MLVSHDIDLMAQYCNRIMILKTAGSKQSAHRTGASPYRKKYASRVDRPIPVDHNPTTGKPRVSLF